jgi:hypothetical protein
MAAPIGGQIVSGRVEDKHETPGREDAASRFEVSEGASRSADDDASLSPECDEGGLSGPAGTAPDPGATTFPDAGAELEASDSRPGTADGQQDRDVGTEIEVVYLKSRMWKGEFILNRRGHRHRRMTLKHEDAEDHIRELAAAEERAFLLAQFAASLAEDGDDRYRILFQDAHEFASQVVDPAERTEVQAYVVRMIGGRDPDLSREISEDARQSAVEISDPLYRAKSLLDSAWALAHADEHPQQANTPISNAAEELASTLADDTRQATSEIADPAVRAGILSDIAVQLAHINLGISYGLIDEAERATAEIAENDERARTLVEIGAKLAATNADRSRQLFEDAERTAKTAASPYNQDLALRKVSQIMAKTDADYAERLANTIRDGYQREKALAKIQEARSDSTDCHTT